MRKAALITACLIGAAALSWVTAHVAGDLSTYGIPKMLWPFGLFGVLAGVAGWAHLTLGPDGADGWNRPSWKALVAAAIAIHLAAALSVPFTSSDLWSNVAYGRMAALGLNPYVGGPSMLPAGDPLRTLVHPMWRDLPMPYGPLVALFCVGPGAMATPWLGMLLFKTLMAAATLGTLLIASRLCRARFDDGEARARFVLLAWCPLFAWELSGQVHNDALLVACLIGFAWAAVAEREALAMVCLTLGVAAKFAAVPVAGLYLVMVMRRSPARAVLYGGGLAAVTVATMLPWWHGLSTLSGLWTNIGPVAGHSARSIGDLIGLVGELHSEATKHAAFRAFSVVGVATAAAMGLLGVVRVRTPASVIHYAMLFFLCGDLFSQAWFQPWYVTWLLVLAVVHPDRRWLSLMALYAALQLLTYMAPIDPVSSVAIDLYIGWRVIRLAREGDAAWALEPARGTPVDEFGAGAVVAGEARASRGRAQRTAAASAAPPRS